MKNSNQRISEFKALKASNRISKHKKGSPNKFMIKCVMRNIFYSLFKEVSVLQIRSVTFKIHQNGQNYNELLVDLTHLSHQGH